MGNSENTYKVEVHNSKFLFISTGQRNLIKAIEFSFVQKLNGKDLYNLGFGDYDLEKDEITDDTNANNGDAYKVFTTVLSAIPVFFKTHKRAVLMVQGSDGVSDFVENCRLTCKKKCVAECKNYNRRIRVYQSYINKNYEELCSDYRFSGGLKDGEGNTNIEPYERYKNYDSVFLSRKNS